MNAPRSPTRGRRSTYSSRLATAPAITDTDAAAARRPGSPAESAFASSGYSGRNAHVFCDTPPA